jgi:hypothetical protein
MGVAGATKVIIARPQVLALHGYRECCAPHTQPPVDHADFEGDVMLMNSTYIARSSIN